MADTNRNNFLDFRRVIEERMAEYSREIEGLEGKLNEEKEKAHRVSLEITEKPTVSHMQVVPTIQHSNQFLEVLEPVAPVTRVTVTKETSPVKAKVVVPLPPADEPEEEEEEAEEEEAEEADNEEEEEEDEPEPEENYEQIRIKKTNYWLETISRKVYAITADGEVGDLVANYKLVNGVATLAPL